MSLTSAYEGESGPSEVSESPRAFGELLVCGQLAAPRTTRFVAGTFAAYALQMAHAEAMPS